MFGARRSGADTWREASYDDTIENGGRSYPHTRTSFGLNVPFDLIGFPFFPGMTACINIGHSSGVLEPEIVGGPDVVQDRNLFLTVPDPLANLDTMPTSCISGPLYSSCSNS